MAFSSLCRAFLGFPAEPKDEAIDVVKAAVLADPDGGPESWERCVLKWAKENGRGMYHPAMLEGPELTYETNDHLRSIGRL